MVRKIISGGQTGADRGALDAAEALYIETGGWCPSGYRTEDGPDPSLSLLGLRETESNGYRDRTERNVLEADSTLIFDPARSSGSLATAILCEKHGRRSVTLRDFSSRSLKRAVEFARESEVLNVAGNRESVWPGIRGMVKSALVSILNPRGSSYWSPDPTDDSLLAERSYHWANRVLVKRGSLVVADLTQQEFDESYPLAKRTWPFRSGDTAPRP